MKAINVFPAFAAPAAYSTIASSGSHLMRVVHGNAPNPAMVAGLAPVTQAFRVFF